MTLPVPYPADVRAKGWRFEVDMEAIKASDTWLLAKSGVVRGALLLLWSEAWQQTPCGTLPNDDELVALMIDMPATAFAKNRKVLMRGWVEADDGRLYHETITKRVLSMLDKRASDAKRAATRRAKNAELDKTPTELPQESRVTPPESPSEFDTKHQAPSTSSKPNGLEKEQRASRLPADWALPNEWREWAKAERPDLDPDRTAEKFADYWRGVGGAKGRKLDWLATWRNWVREERAAPRTNPQASEPQWRTEQRERTQQAAPGVAVKNPKDFFIDVQAKSVGDLEIQEN